MTDFTSSHGILCFPDHMDNKLPTGLWWCVDAEDVCCVETNAVTKSGNATWEDVGKDAELVEQFPYILVCSPPGTMREKNSNRADFQVCNACGHSVG